MMFSLIHRRNSHDMMIPYIALFFIVAYFAVSVLATPRSSLVSTPRDDESQPQQDSSAISQQDGFVNGVIDVNAQRRPPQHTSSMMRSERTELLERIFGEDWLLDASSAEATEWLVYNDTWMSPNEAQWKERLALASLYFAGGQEKDGWMGPQSVCAWKDVECDSKQETIQHIRQTNNYYYLDYIGIIQNGETPSEIGFLTNLQEFGYGDGLDIGGTIPTEIGMMTALTTLTYDYTLKVKGTLPSEIGLLTDLRYFSALEVSGLGGPIPTEIGGLTSLEDWQIVENGFTGTLPSEIGRLTSLTDFRIDDTPMCGQLPTELDLLTNLQYMDFEGTGFSGSIPHIYPHN